MVNGADTAWLLVSCALVMLMTPGLALFYGGMVGSKNVLSSAMHSFIALGVMTLQWIAIGYTLAFGTDIGGFVGGLDFALLRDVGLQPQEGSTIPHMLFMTFQMMFAIITPALISGACAERVKFSSYIVFIVLWGTLVYDPICHWVWGEGGWLYGEALDFAGGTVVHLSSGVAALVFAIMLGKRKRPAPPHNLTLTLLGAALLWFGWFGFNAGSALASGEGATLAFINTHVAAAAAAVSWAAAEWWKQKKPTALGVASGLVAGLVAVTPAAGFVSPRSAVLIGLLAGLICYAAVLMKSKLGYDDALDAFGIHGVGGALGAILTGALASTVWGGSAGWIDGNFQQFVDNVKGVVAAAAYSAAVTFVILKLIDVTIGLRVTEDEESEGLDTNLHGEEGYHLTGAGAMGE